MLKRIPVSRTNSLRVFVVQHDGHKQVLAPVIHGSEPCKLRQCGAIAGQDAGQRGQWAERELFRARIDSDQVRRKDIGSDGAIGIAGKRRVAHAHHAVAKFKRADLHAIEMDGSRRIVRALLQSILCRKCSRNEQARSRGIDLQSSGTFRQVYFDSEAVNVLAILF